MELAIAVEFQPINNLLTGANQEKQRRLVEGRRICFCGWCYARTEACLRAVNRES